MKENRETGLCCHDLLSIPNLKKAVVLAGKSGLDREIITVNVMEVPDVIQWVRTGEFLMTTGYPFREQPEALADLIPQLADKGVAALGIKTKRFMDQVPRRVLELADHYGLPIIELPPSTVFSDIVREVMELVLVKEAKHLSLLQNRFQQMSQLLLHGGGIGEFLDSLEELLHNPVVLLDAYNQPIFSTHRKEWMDDQSHTISWSQLRSDMKLGLSFLQIGERRVRVYISVVSDQQKAESLLILIGWNQDYTPVDTLTIDRVSILAGLEMMNKHARREVELKYVDQFLQDWITGRILTQADLRLRAEACGYDVADKVFYRVGMVRWTEEKPSLKQLQGFLQDLRKVESKGKSESIMYTLVEGELVIVIGTKGSASTSAAGTESVESPFKLPLLWLKSIQLFPFSLCMGEPAPLPNQVNRSYVQAKHIHHVSTVCSMKDELVSYEQLGVFLLLYLLPECEELNQFKKKFLAPLLEYDQAHDTILIPTLQAYFQNNENIRKTAEALFTHYNTVVYRLERVREIIGLKLDNAEVRLQLQLALKLHEMNHGEMK